MSNENIDSMYRAVGSALSNWTRVEIQIYQIFGVIHVLTIMQSGGGFSSDMRIPYAALDTIDSFSSKVRMVNNALKAALEDLDEEAKHIWEAWESAKSRVESNTQNRNKLAHWTVACGFKEGAKVRLVPPPYSNREHQGVSINDVKNWEGAFIATQNLLVDVVSQLTSHHGLQQKKAMQTVEQIRIGLSPDSPLREKIIRDLQN
ncbi:hypothetical protein [Acidovorax sp. 1608163]|uniref:hypothetical protein n=1 Tax=Acidovorax sp. 1608163 TaxID=2478662 RepID=UPI0013CE6F20|nr:hypothetical protein [Acidovorax sp. 1608163]